MQASKQEQRGVFKFLAVERVGGCEMYRWLKAVYDPDILGQLAYLEYKYGDQERSLSLYEDILMKYPKRKNLKFTYISILQELGQHERIERLCN